MKTKKTYKVEYEDKEFKILGEMLFEADDNEKAIKKAGRLARQHYGKVLGVYTIEKNNWKRITEKKAIYSKPYKSTV